MRKTEGKGIRGNRKNKGKLELMGNKGSDGT